MICSETRRVAFCTMSLWTSVRKSATMDAAIRAATAIFRGQGIPEAEASAQHIASVSFGQKQTGVRTGRSMRVSQGGQQMRSKRENEKMNLEELNKFVELCERRERDREPVQYLVGNWDFHHITLLCRRPTLIPRPETEDLVECVLNRWKNHNMDLCSVLDVGCGSGAILMALLASTPSWTGVAIDISKAAVQLASENARLCGVDSRCEILHTDIETFAAAKEEGREDDKKFDMLVSNPPYVPSGQIAGLQAEVSRHEDHVALDGGPDGLRVIEEILRVAPGLVRSGGEVWMEVDTSHPCILRRRTYKSLEYLCDMRDVYGRERICGWKVR